MTKIRKKEITHLLEYKFLKSIIPSINGWHVGLKRNNDQGIQV